MDDILEYENLVWSIVSKYKNYFDKDDLYQVGMIGLMNAYKHFDPNIGTKFSTFAYTYIFGEIHKYVQENRSMKVSRDLLKLNSKIEKGRDVLRQTLMHEPSDYELSIFLEIEEDLIKEAKSSSEMTRSLDALVLEDVALYDQIKVEEKQYSSDILDLKTELNNLEESDKKLIYERYFMDLTQQEVSQNLGMSQVQVSRKESKVLSKLKTRL